MIGKVGVLLALFLLWLPLSVAAQTADAEVYRQQLEAGGVTDLPSQLPANVQELLSQMELTSFDPEDYAALDFSAMLTGLADLLGAQSSGPLQALGTLLGVVLMGGLLTGLEGVCGASPLRDTFHGLAVAGAGAAMLVPLAGLLDTVRQTVEQVTVFLTAYAPVYAAVVATGGHPTGAVAYQATLLGASQLLVWAVQGAVFPVLTVSLAFGCAGSVADGFRLDALSAFLHKGVLWFFGLFSTVYSGLMSVQQLAASAGDTLGGRVIRFSLSSFVPVVGSLLSEAYNTVRGCGDLMRTTVGCFGLVAVVLIVLPPLCSCVCWNLSLHLAAAGAGLFRLTPVERLCHTAAGVVRVLIAMLAVFALLMVVSTVVVATAGR